MTRALSKAEYHVRALTRNPKKSAATFSGLARVEPMYFDVADRASVQAAFKGAQVVFGMAFPDSNEIMAPFGTYVKPRGVLDELEQGRILADVAKGESVEVFAWCVASHASQTFENEQLVDCLDSRLHYQKVSQLRQKRIRQNPRT